MAFNIALSGLNAVTGQLDQISNNIANSGSYGFKSGRANFASAYSQGKAGGVYVGSTTQSMSLGGNVLATGRSLDAAIQGRGFFVARDSNGAMVYSRVGQFNVDKDGFVVDSIGRRVQGYGTASGGVLGDLSMPTEAMPAAASSTLNYAGNMSADWQAPAAPFDMADATTYNGVQVSSLYDSLGRQHTLSQYFVRGAGNDVTVYYAVDGTLVDDGTGPVTSNLQFGTTGQLVAPAAPINIALGTPDGSEPLQVAINYATTTFFGGDFSTTATLRRLSRTGLRRIWTTLRSYTYWRVSAFFCERGRSGASLAAPATATGRLDSEPGTPSGITPLSFSSRVASWVTRGASPYCSRVSSMRSWSTSTATEARKLPSPRVGPSRSWMLRRVSSR